KKALWVYFSHNWYEGRAFPLQTATWIREAGSIPYIRLMLRSDAEQNTAEPVFTLQAIADGQFDADLHNWCAAARDFGTPLLAEYGTEVNGEWFSWNGVWNGAGETAGYGDPNQPDGPERFRDAYRRIIQTCREEGAENITWVFHLNASDWPQEDWNAFENYYPGNDYIDWIGISNYGAQTPQDDVCDDFRLDMDAVYPRLDALTADKPIFIAEFGVTRDNPYCDQVKWTRSALTDITSFRWPRLIAFSWWNEWWQNDDDPAHDTHMCLQDNPELAAVFQELVGDNPVVLGEKVQVKPYVAYALRTADYLLSQQNTDGAIPDVPNGETVNMDSNMEYALIGLAAAYQSSRDPRYLDGLEKGIRWLADREEMTDPQWRGSWFYAYSSAPPYDPIPTSPDDPAILDVRGVDATSALFAYLLYLHSAVSGSDALALEYETHARAALDFVLTHNQSADGFFYSSWQKWASDGHWHLWPFRYAADQGDVYLGMQAGWNLYNDARYRDVAIHLQEQMPAAFFDASQGRYATGIYEDGGFESELEGFDGIFPQGYLAWVFGENQFNHSAFDWLTSCIQPDGSLVCYPDDPRFSLSVSLYAMSAAAMGKPYPTQSVDWLLANTLDEQDGSIRDTLDPDSEKHPNVAGFSVVALLGFPALPTTTPPGVYLPLVLR
ncbi:MAG: glycosyl hydrolase, partial [Chloroflexota bacterium]